MTDNPKPKEEGPFFEEEPDNEYSMELFKILEDVTEKSDDGVEKIKLAHDKMDEVAKPLVEKVGKRIIEII